MIHEVELDEKAVIRSAREYVASRCHEAGVRHLIQRIRVPIREISDFTAPFGWSLESIGSWHGIEPEPSVCAVLRRKMPAKPGPKTILPLAAEIMGRHIPSQITLTWLAKDLWVSSGSIENWLIEAGLCERDRHRLKPAKPKFAGGLIFWMQARDMDRLHAKPPESRERESFPAEDAP